MSVEHVIDYRATANAVFAYIRECERVKRGGYGLLAYLAWEFIGFANTPNREPTPKQLVDLGRAEATFRRMGLLKMVDSPPV